MLYLIDLEAVDTRYTAQWKVHLPQQLEQAGIPTTVISGGDVPQTTTPGAFLNFAGTNSYKSQQMLKLAELFAAGKINHGDYFLYTDAWNPTVIQLKYMAELLGIKIKVGGMWHAGSYDPQDFLGRIIGDQMWVRNSESAMFHCFDHNFFATEFHLKMFINELFGEEDIEKWKEYYPGTVVVGWPMEYLSSTLSPYANLEKKDKIIFPHRIAHEKQLSIFNTLSMRMPEYEWFVAQEHNLTKDEYHKHLGESKIVFSANLQETLGISVYEGALVGAYPLMPNRLSYTEMWPEGALYPSEWTMPGTVNTDELEKVIRGIMNNYSNKMREKSIEIANTVGGKYFNGAALYQTIIDSQV